MNAINKLVTILTLCKNRFIASKSKNPKIDKIFRDIFPVRLMLQISYPKFLPLSSAFCLAYASSLKLPFRSYRPVVRPPGQQRAYLDRLKMSNPRVYGMITSLSTRGKAAMSEKHRKSTKSMQESYVEEFLRFKSNPEVKEDYLNYYGDIRIGKILEDLDALAGSISYLHCSEKMSAGDVVIVTASVGSICYLY